MMIMAIKENKYITTSEFSEKFNKSTITIQRHINQLTKSGKLERVGSRKSGYYISLNNQINQIKMKS